MEASDIFATGDEVEITEALFKGSTGTVTGFWSEENKSGVIVGFVDIDDDVEKTVYFEYDQVKAVE